MILTFMVVYNQLHTYVHTHIHALYSNSNLQSCYTAYFQVATCMYDINPKTAYRHLQFTVQCAKQGRINSHLTGGGANFSGWCTGVLRNVCNLIEFL